MTWIADLRSSLTCLATSRPLRCGCVSACVWTRRGRQYLIAFPASTDVSVGLEDLYPGDLAWEWFDGK